MKLSSNELRTILMSANSINYGDLVESGCKVIRHEDKMSVVTPNGIQYDYTVEYNKENPAIVNIIGQHK